MSAGNTTVKKLMVKASTQARNAAFGRCKRWSEDGYELDGHIVQTMPRRSIERCDPPAVKVKDRPVYSTRIVETHW